MCIFACNAKPSEDNATLRVFFGDPRLSKGELVFVGEGGGVVLWFK